MIPAYFFTLILYHLTFCFVPYGTEVLNYVVVRFIPGHFMIPGLHICCYWIQSSWPIPTHTLKLSPKFAYFMEALRLVPMAFQKDMPFFWSIFLFFDIRCLKTCLVFSPSEPWNQLLLREALIYSWMVFRNQYLGARYAYSPGVSLLISPRTGHMYIIYTIRTNPHAQACSYLILYLCT